MIKVKDGYAKLIGTTYSGSANRVLLSNGGDKVLGNASGNIPLNNGTVNTNLNADLLDGLHGSWYLKNVLAFKRVLGINDAGGYDLNTLTEGIVHNYGGIGYWKNGPSGMLYGKVLNLKDGDGNGLSALLAWDVMHASTTDTTRNLWWRASDDGTFTEAQWHQIAFTDNIPTVTDYYWANVKVSETSNSTTKPTFATVTATTSVTTPLVTNSNVLELNGTSGIYLRYNDIDASSLVLSSTYFKPFDSANNKISLGTTSARWSNVYSVAGNFSGNVTIAGTMSSANYLLGTELELKTDDTACQTTVFGSNGSGYRMRIVRQATSSNLNTLYSPTLVLSSLDTHAYIAWKYDSDSVWVGAGSNNKWTWRSKLITSSNYTNYVNTTNFPGLNKTGTVTSVTVTAGTGLSGGGTITTSGTVTLNNTGILHDSRIDISENASYRHIGYGYTSEGWYSTGSAIAIGASSSYYMMLLGVNGEKLYYSYCYNKTKSDWKKIAFTSDIPTKTSQLTNDSGFVTGGPYLPLSGGIMDASAYIAWNSGADGNDVSDWNINNNGLRIISSSVATSNAPTTYATALHVKGRYGFQIAGRGGTSSDFWIRNTDSSSNAWNTIIHSNNYTSYTVKKDGTGASGNWGINITGNAASSTYTTNIRVTETEPTTGTYYYPIWTAGMASGTNYTPRANDGFRYYTLEGTTSANGTSLLFLGNSTASGTAGNKEGRLGIYGPKSYYAYLYGPDTATGDFYFPNTGGTLVTHATRGTAVGAPQTPVYIAASGRATACTIAAGSGNINRSLVVTDGSNKMYYTSTITGNYDTGSLISTVTDTTSVSHTCKNSNGSVSLYAATNRGLWDTTNSAWIIYLTKAADHVYVPKWASKGGSTTPVYFNSSGEPVACTAYSGLLTSVTSTADVNISVTVGGTTKSVSDAYTTYAVGTYTGNGGGLRPSYIGSGLVRWNMMNASTTYFDSLAYSGYCDWMMMDTYTGSDVSYVTMIGVLKASSPRAFIASGAKGDSSGKWTIKELALKTDVPSIPSVSITNAGSGNAVTSITASGHTLTVTKGSTFSLSEHTHAYVPLAGTTALTGSIEMKDTATSVPFVRNFTSTGTTGWARDVLAFKVDDTAKFTIGAFGTYTAGGSSNGIEYAYIGCNAYNGVNLRIASNSLKWGTNNILHAGNSSVSGGGTTWGSSITVNINGTSKTLTIPNAPSIGNGTITITQGGTTKGSFTLNLSGNATIALTDSNTDTKVTLSQTTTSEYRPVVLGYASHATAGSTALYATLTNVTYTTNTIYALPSTGKLYASQMHSSSYHSSGVQALAYATSSSGWTGVDIASIVVGSVSYPTILRSSTDNLYHYNANKSAKYLVLDAFNSSVSGGGSTWGSNIEVTIGNTAKKLTIPNIYWGIYEITVGNTASFVTKNENHRFISSVSKSGNEAFINVDYPDGFDMGSTLISTMGIGSLFLWVHRTSYGSNSLLYALRSSSTASVTGSFLILFLCIG